MANKLKNNLKPILMWANHIWNMKSFFIFFFLMFAKLSFAYEVDKISAGDNLEKVAKRNLGRVWTKYSDAKEYAEDIKKWNPKISDWNNPPQNQIIFVDFPYDNHVAGTTWAPVLGLYEEPNTLNRKFSLGAFYASSFGNYKEITSEQIVNSGQNFPVTLGLEFNSTNDEKKHFILGSAYLAQSSKGKVTGNSTSTTTELSIPGEIGFNLYYQYYLKESLLGIYSGYDFEKINTFNTSEIVSGSPLVNVDNKIHYATIGLSQGFSLFDLKMNLKASLSKTIASTTSGSKSLEGVKYILFYTVKPEGRFSFNVFYKHHELKGPTQLSIDRIGMSVGVLVF